MWTNRCRLSNDPAVKLSEKTCRKVGRRPDCPCVTSFASETGRPIATYSWSSGEIMGACRRDKDWDVIWAILLILHKRVNAKMASSALPRESVLSWAGIITRCQTWACCSRRCKALQMIAVRMADTECTSALCTPCMEGFKDLQRRCADGVYPAPMPAGTEIQPIWLQVSKTHHKIRKTFKTFCDLF